MWKCRRRRRSSSCVFRRRPSRSIAAFSKRQAECSGMPDRSRRPCRRRPRQRRLRPISGCFRPVRLRGAAVPAPVASIDGAGSWVSQALWVELARSTEADPGQAGDRISRAEQHQNVESGQDFRAARIRQQRQVLPDSCGGDSCERPRHEPAGRGFSRRPSAGRSSPRYR